MWIKQHHLISLEFYLLFTFYCVQQPDNNSYKKIKVFTLKIVKEFNMGYIFIKLIINIKYNTLIFRQIWSIVWRHLTLFGHFSRKWEAFFHGWPDYYQFAQQFERWKYGKTPISHHNIQIYNFDYVL
jgi:hypothetical protein